MDGQLVIEQVEGTLAGPLSLRGVRYENESIALELQEANLDWLPSVILFSDALVHVEHLRLQGLRVVLIGTDVEKPDVPQPASPLPESLSLPVSIRVDEFELTQAVILRKDLTASDPSERAQLDRVAAIDLVWDEAGIDLPELEIKTPEIDLQANGNVNPKGNWPLRLDAAYTISMASMQLPDVAGRTRVSGTLAQLKVNQQIDAPYAVDARANITDALATPQWQASVSVMGAQLKALQADLPDVLLDAEIAAQGNAARAGLTVDISAAQTALRVTGDLTFAGTLDNNPTVDLSIDWQDLVWPLGAGQVNIVASKTGHAEISGKVDDYQVSVKADILLPEYPQGSLDITGAGSTTMFAVQKFELAVLGGLVRGLAQVDWQSGLTSSFDLTGTTLDTGGILPDWPGQLNFSVQGDALLPSDALLQDARINVTDLVLDGVLRDMPVNAEMMGSYADAELLLPSLEFTTLDTTLQANGTVALSDTGRTDFNWQFSLADLSLWQQEAQGSVQASGQLVGNLREPRLQTKAVMNGIRLQGLSLQNAAISADLGLDQLPLSLQVVVDDIDVAQTSLQQVTLNLEGSHADHSLRLSMTNEAGQAEFAALGSLSTLPALGALAPLSDWQDVIWQLAVTALNIGQGELAVALLQPNEARASTATVSANSFGLENTCFSLLKGDVQSADADNLQQLCAQATGSYTDKVSGLVTLDNLSINVLDSFLPETLSLQGRIKGDLSADLDLSTGSAQADLSLSTSAVVLQKLNSRGDQQTLLAFAPGKLSGNLLDDILRADINLPRNGEEGLQAKVSIAADQGEGFSTRALEADIAAKLSDLDWVADFIPGVSQLDGVFTSNLRISGTVAAPNLTGDLILSNTNATLPDPGLRLREVNLILRGGGDNDLTLEGNALSGRGEMSVSGDLRDIGKGMNGRVDLTGSRFLLLNTPEAEIIASPKVTAQLTQGAVEISGDISVDKADIVLKSLPQTAASVSDDQIIVTPESEAADVSENLQVTTKIRLLLNDAVTFEGFGLKSTFTGALNITDLPDEPTTAQGEVSVVEGRYQAYGQDLTIERGRLLFVGGPIDQPGLDVRAVRQATPDVKVGVIARGSLRAPEFSIFSQPAMSQSNQLAYLILGRPLNEGTSSESSALSRAALALGIQGGNYLTEQYGDKLGVDTIGIEAPAGETNEQASLVVGKYLSPRLYVSYGIGILDAINTLKIEYILSSKWCLVYCLSFCSVVMVIFIINTFYMVVLVLSFVAVVAVMMLVFVDVTVFTMMMLVF
ncbi:tamB [Symbiodinium pilosum]|uniref:TamB protein n=1 Tax=Symbiodinium pilosum TaxID=2952 RepID=A0A812NRY3_SYMPI|nr:tamB [Symbiodinium pilosum]